MNGKGTYYYADGNIYEGQWVEGNKHGEGSHTWVDGLVRDRLTLPPHPTRNPRPKSHPDPGPDPNPVPSPNQVYKGQWVDDTMHGRGKYVFPNGNTYEGQYEAGVRHGKGKFTYANGGVYTGGFANGKKNGFVSCSPPAAPLQPPAALGSQGPCPGPS